MPVTEHVSLVTRLCLTQTYQVRCNKQPKRKGYISEQGPIVNAIKDCEKPLDQRASQLCQVPRVHFQGAPVNGGQMVLFQQGLALVLHGNCRSKLLSVEIDPPCTSRRSTGYECGSNIEPDVMLKILGQKLNRLCFLQVLLARPRVQQGQGSIAMQQVLYRVISHNDLGTLYNLIFCCEVCVVHNIPDSADHGTASRFVLGVA